MVRSEEVRVVMLEGPAGLDAIYALLRSTNPDAVRCAACALAMLTMHGNGGDAQGGKSGSGGAPPRLVTIGMGSFAFFLSYFLLQRYHFVLSLYIQL